MPQAVRLLHITDTHLKLGGSDLPLDDRKVNPGLEPQTREISVEDALARLAEGLGDRNERLDGLIFGGDALSAAQAGGDEILLELVLRHLSPHGIRPECIVAVPGNHDISRDTSPTTEQRYAQFRKVWRDAGCVTPWLDGVDDAKPTAASHVLMASDRSWAVIAVNSCNWSHVDALSPALRRVWKSIPSKLAGDDSDLAKELGKELDKLSRYDMARVSPEQLAALRAMLRTLPKPATGEQLRLMTLHHHMRAPSVAEEVKPFADLSNLEQVRAFVAEHDIRVVLHGHKHESRIHSDFIETEHRRTPHRVLMVAGGSFSAADHSDAMRLLDLTGLPWVPTLRVQPLAIPRKGLTGVQTAPTTSRLWSTADDMSDPPVVIQGSDFDAVYARVQEAAKHEAQGKTLIVQLDLDNFSAVKRLPEGYPGNFADQSDRQEWLRQLVDWWQLPQSQLQERIPYIHGMRLRKYASNLDQIERVRLLLKEKPTTRAIAVLVDPTIDFKEGEDRTDFASFCLVQFSRRDESGGRKFVDCIGYYRAQEMVKWWPINVAELLDLQTQVGDSFGGKPGRITTITACARSLARQPTHVAMPVIDRWLDQSPEKYFVLASALLSGAPLTEAELRVLREWNVCLAELKDAADAAIDGATDGGAVVAIEGPRRLAKYLRSGSGERATECKNLAEKLDDIARAGVQIGLSDKPEWVREWGTLLSKYLSEALDVFQSKDQ